MPYDPYAVTQKQRNWAYVVTWLGAACAVVMLVMHLAFPGYEFPGLVVGGTAGGLIGAIVPNRMDEYYQGLCALGCRFATAFMGFVLLAAWISIGLFDDGKPTTAFSKALSDPVLIGICAALAYYFGYATAWLRDRIGV